MASVAHLLKWWNDDRDDDTGQAWGLGLLEIWRFTFWQVVKRVNDLGLGTGEIFNWTNEWTVERGAEQTQMCGFGT